MNSNIDTSVLRDMQRQYDAESILGLLIEDELIDREFDDFVAFHHNNI